MLGRHGWARIRTLYGFNTVVVVGFLQVVVLMNEAFLFDWMLCHGVHSFSSLDDYVNICTSSFFFHHSYGCRFHGSRDKP